MDRILTTLNLAFALLFEKKVLREDPKAKNKYALFLAKSLVDDNLTNAKLIGTDDNTKPLN